MAWYQESKLVKSGEVHEEDSHTTPYLIYACLMTIVAVMTILVVLVMRKRIALVVQLFKEAGKAVYSMPALLLQPIYVSRIYKLYLLNWLIKFVNKNFFYYRHIYS